MNVSVLILTLNEEANLSKCLQSVKWSDDIVVFDSFSSDKTIEIAKVAGARIVQRRFDNWAAHQNWAVQNNISFKHPWVFYIDADERCDEMLAKELADISRTGEGYSAFQVRRKDFFMGKWLKRAQLYPTWLTRVFRPEKIRYERLVNPIAIVDGPAGQLRGHLIHHPFSHGIAHWYERHNNYSTMEAQCLVQEIHSNIDWLGLFSKDPARKRKAKKCLAYRMPFRSLCIFLYLLIIRRSFFDGMPGVYFSIMRATYEFMIDLKVKELQRYKKGLPI